MPLPATIFRGPLLNPTPDGRVAFTPDAVLAADAGGTLTFVGPFERWRREASADAPPVQPGRNVIMPPLLDVHIHIPQHPIRGHFLDGVEGEGPSGRLLAGLDRNVFPAERLCEVEQIARDTAAAFLADTLANGVVGGAAYMTLHPAAVRAALDVLPDTWSVGLVLMNQNCPEYLRTDEATLERDVEALAADFGRRLIVTDRFAVAVDSPLRRRASDLAGRLGLRTQTHLNEQIAEKAFVETSLYPDADSYADVYRRDGLLGHDCILAHCIYMSEAEWRIAADTGSAVAHCPTSNALLGSGVMPLDERKRHGLPYAIATDVGASPTCSMLAEMAAFLKVHAGRSTSATPAEALYRSTCAPADILGLHGELGTLAPGRPASFIEVDPGGPLPATADDAILQLLNLNRDALAAYATDSALGDLRDGRADDRTLDALNADLRRDVQMLEGRVRRVVLRGTGVPPASAT